MLNRHILTQAHFKSATKMYENALKFYTGNYKEVRSHLQLTNKIIKIIHVLC